jgi:hypothetical protein
LGEGHRSWRATFAGQPQFEAAAAQVNANTKTLAKALSGIVGPEKAEKFETAWANHVEGLMAYTAAAASNNEAAKDYTRAQQMEQEGYLQMLGVANTLVDAIQRTVKRRLPVGGSKTGGGGLACRRR